MTTAKTQTMQINKGHRSSRGKWSDQSCEFLKWMIKRACIDSSPLKAHLSTILKLRTAYIIKNPCATRGVSQATLAAMQGKMIGKYDSGVIFHVL